MKQASSLLPVPYAHVVFTVPEQLAPLALRNQRLFYNLLFRAASETLLEIAADPRHLGARIGVLAVLHTWSQNLGHHPHLHCLVPAGGLALDRSRWVRSRRNFFLPVRVLSRVSAASCSPSSSRAIDTTNYASPARWLRSLSRVPFTLCSQPCAARSGWSTPSLPSAVPNTC
jgi:hypothetical protein